MGFGVVVPHIVGGGVVERERERERDRDREAVTEFREKKDCNDQIKALATSALYFKKTSHN